MCCAVVGEDVCEGSAGSGGGALSVFCSGACGAGHLQEKGGLTEVRTVVGRCLDLELTRDKEQLISFMSAQAQTYSNTISQTHIS